MTVTESIGKPNHTAENAVSVSAPLDGVNAPSAQRAREVSVHDHPETAPQTAVADSDGIAKRLDRFGRRMRPPHPWAHRPASLQAMWRWVRIGLWTGPLRTPVEVDAETGAVTKSRINPVRAAGIAYYCGVAVPVTVACHYGAWLAARPSRAITALAVWLVAMQIPAIAAAVRILFTPVRAVAGLLIP